MHTRIHGSSVRWLAAAALLACGCGSSSSSHPNFGSGSDAGVSTDGGALPDLAPAADMAQVAEGLQHRYVINQLVLPMANKEYAIDLNGDGRVDNQLGNIIGTLAANNLAAQSGIDQSIASGQVLELVRLDSVDPRLSDDANAPVTIYTGKVKANPDFSGTGSFVVDNAVAPAAFNGGLTGGHYASEDPVTTHTPVTLSLKLSLVQGSSPLPLTLHGAHVVFDTGTDAQTGAPGLLTGRLHGSISNADVQTIIIPAIAVLLTQRIQADPNSPGSKQIEGIFDTGGCGTAKANDNVIDVCEVAGNSIIMAILAPDVQIFDGNGKYAPNPQNTKKDSLSVGLAFTAVRAKF